MGTKRKRNARSKPAAEGEGKTSTPAGDSNGHGRINADDLTAARPTNFANREHLRVLTGSLDSVLGGYDFFLSPFKVHPVFHETAHVMAMTAIAQGGRYLATGAKDEKIWLWDLKKRLTLGELFEHQDDITWLGFHGKYLISCDAAGLIIITRTSDWEPVARMKSKGRVNHFALHPTGRVALSVGSDRTVRLWNMMTGRKASVNKIYAAGLAVEWNRAGDAYAIMFDRKVVTYGIDARMKHEVSFTTRLHCMAYVSCRGSEYLLMACEDGSLRFCLDGQEVKTFKAHSARIKSISVFEQYLVSASSDGMVKVFDLEQEVFVGEHKTADRLTLVLAIDPGVEHYVPVKELKAEEEDVIKTEDEFEVE